MNIVSLRRRFACTIIDKVLILFLFIVFFGFCNGQQGAKGLAILTIYADIKYKNIDVTNLDVYQEYICYFIITNLLYYLLCEYFFKASLGKRMLKCQIRKKNGSMIDKHDVLSRIGILLAILLLAVGLQMVLNINIYITSILFFGILDYTVFTKQQSLVDKCSGTVVVKMT